MAVARTGLGALRSKALSRTPQASPGSNQEVDPQNGATVFPGVPEKGEEKKNKTTTTKKGTLFKKTRPDEDLILKSKSHTLRITARGPLARPAIPGNAGRVGMGYRFSRY